MSLRASLIRALLALGLSFALWVFVSFSLNPEETVSFPDITPQITGLSPGLVIVDANGLPSTTLLPVDITLRTDRAQRTGLRQVDIRAVVDLTDLGPGEHIVPVNVQPTRSNVSFSVPDDGVEPSALPIRLEQVITRTVPIDLIVQGNLPFSFERGDPEITFVGDPIGEVEVSGPQSRVERVVAAQTQANIEQLRASYIAPLGLNPVDEAGQLVEGVRVTPGTVTVAIPINAVVGLKVVPVQANVVGLPAAGYVVTDLRIEPPLITLAGSSGQLDDVTLLQTTAIDISGAQTSQSSLVDVRFPSGTSPDLGQPSQVRVTVAVAPISRPFQAQLPAQVRVVGLSPGLLLSLSPQVVEITLTGPASALNELGESSLQATVDLSGLGPGSYQLPAVVDLPAGASLVGEPPVVAVTLRLPPPTSTPPPEETPTAAPEPTATPAEGAGEGQAPTETPAPTATTEPAPQPTPTP